jgi:hypothetical protein
LLSDIATIRDPDKKKEMRAKKEKLKDLLGKRKMYDRVSEIFGGTFPTEADIAADVAAMDQAANQPVREEVIVHRSVSSAKFMAGYTPNDARVPDLGLTGETQTEPGYMSTSTGRNAAFPGRFHLHIRVPAGARGVWLGYASRYPKQRELILGRGTQYRIVRVDPPSRVNKTAGTWQIYAEVIVPGR